MSNRLGRPVSTASTDLKGAAAIGNNVKENIKKKIFGGGKVGKSKKQGKGKSSQIKQESPKKTTEPKSTKPKSEPKPKVEKPPKRLQGFAKAYDHNLAKKHRESSGYNTDTSHKPAVNLEEGTFTPRQFKG